MKKSRKVISTLSVGIILEAAFTAGERVEELRYAAKAYAIMEAKKG